MPGKYFIFDSCTLQLRFLFKFFLICKVQKKKTLIEQVFGKGLAFDGMIYRTPYINPLFMSKVLILSNKKLLKINKKTGIQKESPL